MAGVVHAVARNILGALRSMGVAPDSGIALAAMCWQRDPLRRRRTTLFRVPTAVQNM